MHLYSYCTLSTIFWALSSLFKYYIIHTHYGLAGRRLNSHARAKLHNNFFNVAYNLRYHFIVTINSEEISDLVHVLLSG